VTEIEGRNRYASLNNNTPVNHPVYCPMPIPYYMPMPIPQTAFTYDATSNYGSQYPKSFFKKPNVINTKKNMKRWKKVVHCILFTFYLRRFCKLIQESRK
jgi:hypothetical protein